MPDTTYSVLDLRTQLVTAGQWLDAAVASETDECLVFPFSVNWYGYGQAQIRGRTWRAHRYVLVRASGGVDPAGMQAAHSCGNRLCCNPKHLRWATAAENASDRKRHGTEARGGRNGKSILSEASVRSIKRALASGESALALAKRHEVSRSAIGDIRSGKTWGWVA